MPVTCCSCRGTTSENCCFTYLNCCSGGAPSMHMFVGFVQTVVDHFSTFREWLIYLSLWLYITWKLSFCLTNDFSSRSLLVLLLWYNVNYDWGTLSFSKMLNMGSYDFVTVDKFGRKWLDIFLAPCSRIWLFSGLNLAPWQNVDLATLH